MTMPHTMASAKPKIASPPTSTNGIMARNVVTWVKHRARQRLVDRQVEQLGERHLLVFAQVLADPVEDHDLVVERIADDGEDRGDARQVELELERRIEPDGAGHVMDQRGDGARPRTAIRT